MDRRDFLKAAAALPAAAYLPAGEARPVLNVAAIKAAVERTLGYMMGDWYVFLHPQQERDLRDLQARGRWRFAYKAWRKDGKPPISCQAILDKYTPPSEFDFPARTDEIGRYEGVRFITTERVT